MAGKRGSQPHTGLVTLGWMQETDRVIAAEIASRDVPVGLDPRFVQEHLRGKGKARQLGQYPATGEDS